MKVDAVSVHDIKSVGGGVAALTVTVIVGLLPELTQLIIAWHSCVKLTVAPTIYDTGYCNSYNT